jgi:hypothetical protein
VTTRGLGLGHMRDLARWIDEGIDAARRGDEAALASIRGAAGELARALTREAEPTSGVAEPHYPAPNDTASWIPSRAGEKICDRPQVEAERRITPVSRQAIPA